MNIPGAGVIWMLPRPAVKGVVTCLVRLLIGGTWLAMFAHLAGEGVFL